MVEIENHPYFRQKILKGKRRKRRELPEDDSGSVKKKLEAKRKFSRKLSQHRLALLSSKNAYTRDLSRVVETCRKHLLAMGFRKLRPSNDDALALVRKYVYYIAQSQGFKPYFHVRESRDGPYCWNSPSDWNFDHIRYQWGHVSPRSEDRNAHALRNLCLQSARCNLHVQSALHINQVEKWLHGSAVSNRITEMRLSRDRLFRSKKWMTLEEEFEDYR